MTGYDDARQMARVTVWDSGRGLSVDEAARVFEPLSGTGRNAHIAAKNGEGAGLSLYLAREHLKQMSGDISVESAPGSGSRFHIYLPVE